MQPQTLNRYAYVTNNPATYSDLLGYRAVLPDRGGLARYIPSRNHCSCPDPPRRAASRETTVEVAESA